MFHIGSVYVQYIHYTTLKSFFPYLFFGMIYTQAHTYLIQEVVPRVPSRRHHRHVRLVRAALAGAEEIAVQRGGRVVDRVPVVEAAGVGVFTSGEKRRISMWGV